MGNYPFTLDKGYFTLIFRVTKKVIANLDSDDNNNNNNNNNHQGHLSFKEEFLLIAKICTNVGSLLH